ncbi:MAG: hypothetical protein R3E32_03945 [Chitinophagales bacterium]
MKRIFVIFLSLLSIALFFDTVEIQAQPSNRALALPTGSGRTTTTYNAVTNFNGYMRFRTAARATKSLHIEYGSLQATSNANPAWLSAMWEILPVAGTTEFVHIRNRWKPDQYLHTVNGQVVCGPVSDITALETMWKIETDGSSYRIQTRLTGRGGTGSFIAVSSTDDTVLLDSMGAAWLIESAQ